MNKINPEQLDLLLSSLSKEKHEPQDKTLQVAFALSNLPKKPFPTPIKSYRFEEPTFLQKLLTIKNFSFASAFILFLSITGLAKISSSATPGSTLYPVKIAFEQANLSLKVSPENKAQYRLTLTERRLQEADGLLVSPTLSQSQKEETLAVLQNQIEETLTMVGPIAKDLAVKEEKTDLLTAVEKLNDKTASTVAAITTDELKTATATKELLATAETSKQQTEEVRKTLFAAGKESETSDSPSSTTTGTLKKVTFTELTIQNQIFTIDTQTVYLPTGTTISSLKAGAKVEINWDKDGEQLKATTIRLLSPLKPRVKPATDIPTTTPNENPDNEGVIESNNSKPLQRAGFIPEDPNPQFTGTPAN